MARLQPLKSCSSLYLSQEGLDTMGQSRNMIRLFNAPGECSTHLLPKLSSSGWMLEQDWGYVLSVRRRWRGEHLNADAMQRARLPMEAVRDIFVDYSDGIGTT